MLQLRTGFSNNGVQIIQHSVRSLHSFIHEISTTGRSILDTRSLSCLCYKDSKGLFNKLTLNALQRVCS